MNPHEIDRLLREAPPELPPPPGLEARIRSSLHAAPRPTPTVLRPLCAGLGLAALAGTAALVALQWLAQHPTTPPPAANHTPPATTTPATPPLTNPLRTEAQALRRDADRAGRFLLDCLPSLTTR